MTNLFYQAISSYYEGAFEQALIAAKNAWQAEPENVVYQQAILYLQKVVNDGKPSVYTTPAGFAEFIRGGGNVGLYQQTSAALKRVYEGYESLSLLDVGVGDGMALLPAFTPQIHTLDLIEPSPTLLTPLSQKLSEQHIPHHAHACTLQQFVTTKRGNWDVAQATFSFHTIPPAERLGLLRWVREHCGRFLLVEFDVPAFSHMLDPKTVAYYVQQYEKGLAEYAGNSTVIQGFLMPVFFSNFDQNTTRLTFEQPISAWEADLRQVGFTTIRRQRLYDYWWAAAYLLEAIPSSPALLPRGEG
jgi:hypothetical protein